MHIVYKMIGYDKRTERLEIEHDIPSTDLEAVRRAAQVPASDPELMGSYPVNAAAAQTLAWKINKTIRLEAYDWFVEPFASP